MTFSLSRVMIKNMDFTRIPIYWSFRRCDHPKKKKEVGREHDFLPSSVENLTHRKLIFCSLFCYCMLAICIIVFVTCAAN